LFLVTGLLVAGQWLMVDGCWLLVAGLGGGIKETRHRCAMCGFFHARMPKRASQLQDWLRRSSWGEASKKPGIAARCAGFFTPECRSELRGARIGFADPLGGRHQRNPASLRDVRVFSRPNAEASFAFEHEKTRRLSAPGFSVGNTGFEPVTPALSRRCSKPTELIALADGKSTEREPNLREAC
jgi:hypothetical protein